MAMTRKYDLYSKDFRQNSHAIFAQMRAEAPLIKQIGLDGETPIWFITRYQEAQKVLSDDKHFVRDLRLALTSDELERIFGKSDGHL